jgi:hypothetical protein
MTLPEPEATHRWQGRTLVDRNGEPVGSIQRIYRDKATDQPEWALLAAGAAAAEPTFVPLINATEEGDTIRTPFEKALVEGAPSVPAGREISEDQEEELYRHYGVPYSRAESPSGLPADQPQPASRSGSGGTPELPVSESTATAQPVPAAAPFPAGPDTAPSQAAGTGDTSAAGARLRIDDPRVVAAASGAMLAVGAGVWWRKLIGRQITTAVGGLAGLPGSLGRRRRERRRAETFDQAVATATQQTTALARATARLLASMSLLPAASAIVAGRRARAAFQGAQQEAGQRARRPRSGSRRARRRRKSSRMIAGTAAISRLAAIPRTVRGRRRRRRRAKVARQSVAKGAGQVATLAWIAARLLVGTALLPATSAMRTGRRAWGGVQATQRAVRRSGRRLRRGSRRRRRRRTLGVIVGGAAGYVLGARAGEQGYQAMARTAKGLMERPEVKRASDRAMATLDQLSGRAADKLQQSRERTPAEAAGSQTTSSG